MNYEEFQEFCAIWNIEPKAEDENWEQQYEDNIHYMETGEGYPTRLKG